MCLNVDDIFDYLFWPINKSFSSRAKTVNYELPENVIFFSLHQIQYLSI